MSKISKVGQVKKRRGCLFRQMVTNDLVSKD